MRLDVPICLLLNIYWNHYLQIDIKVIMRRNRKLRELEENIDSGSIKRRTIVKNSITSHTVLCWRIQKYHELKNKILYYQIYEDSDFSCVFKLIKMEGTLYVALRCHIPNRPSSFHLANRDSESHACASKEILGGLYVGEFSIALVCSPNGDLIKFGLLRLVFTFEPQEAIVHFRDKEYPNLGDMSDIDVLCYDIRQMYLQGLNSDFVIHAKGASFKVHKYVLFARSEFFKKFFMSRNHLSQYTIKRSEGVIHLVLLYCYSGELPYMKDTYLMDILEAAKDLKIPSLIDRCEKELVQCSVGKNLIKSSDMSSGVSATELSNVQDCPKT